MLLPLIVISRLNGFTVDLKKAVMSDPVWWHSMNFCLRMPPAGGSYFWSTGHTSDLWMNSHKIQNIHYGHDSNSFSLRSSKQWHWFNYLVTYQGSMSQL